MDAQAAALRKELDSLPLAPSDQSTERKGWHSSLSWGANPSGAVKALRLDLGGMEEFDAVVLVPVNVPYRNHPGPGFGFPIRFRVEVADESSFSMPQTVADFTGADFSNPGSLPVFIPTPHARGRHVRVLATRLFARENDALFALGEFMVFRGARNLASAAKVSPSESYDNIPTWHPDNVNDGQSVLGPPLRLTGSPGNGYHALIEKNENTVKWVQLDLGKPMPVDEVRIFSARPTDFPVKPGFGFPVRFRLEAGNSPDMGDAVVLWDQTGSDFVNPGDNPALFPGRGVEARYVRLTATRLWRRDDFVFALSEIQVFSGDRNVALEAVPAAMDCLEAPRWQLRFINDGYSSQGVLLDWSQWLRELSRRRELEQQLAGLGAARAPLVEAAWRRIWWSVAAVVAGLLAVLALIVSRMRRLRRIEVRKLRSRIAADLHDEIGSNLASIALLSRLSFDHGGEAARGDLLEINRIAQETADSMRDIVWLMQPGPRSAVDLVTRMREISARLLGGLECRFEAGEVRGPFTLDFERQTLLLFKEALNNIRKHSGARSVSISVRQDERTFHLLISDDGVGFDTAQISTGIGLGSMKDRAGAVGGELAIHTTPTTGTRIELQAKLT